MKVIAFNGSPNKDGNTSLLIKHVLTEIEKEGIKTEVVQIGGKKVSPCSACWKCMENKDNRCVQDDDMVNDCIEKMIGADAIIIGSPTYFASVTPEIKAFMDRAFFVAKANDSLFQQKLGASVIAVRRAGAVCVYDTINHYFGISGMYSTGSIYWNLGIGLKPGDVENDPEGIETMKQIGQNIAWFVKEDSQKVSIGLFFLFFLDCKKQISPPTTGTAPAEAGVHLKKCGVGNPDILKRHPADPGPAVFPAISRKTRKHDHVISGPGDDERERDGDDPRGHHLPDRTPLDRTLPSRSANADYRPVDRVRR
jgi:multimeric flavodoxin WrbA